jgi:hypothetical protein
MVNPELTALTLEFAVHETRILALLLLVDGEVTVHA